jgi:hypothetical protein
MLYKAGTTKAMQKIREEASGVPKEVLNEALRVVKILDEVFGADRDVDLNDGGFVMIAENVQDLASIKEQREDLDWSQYEVVAVVQCAKEPWLNVLFLCNNEFGINIFMPASIAPSALRRDAHIFNGKTL